jgi:hypothetical protein
LIAIVIGSIRKKERPQSILSTCLKDSVKVAASTPWNDMRIRKPFNEAIRVASRITGAPRLQLTTRHLMFAIGFTLIELLVVIVIIAPGQGKG